MYLILKIELNIKKRIKYKKKIKNNIIWKI